MQWVVTQTGPQGVNIMLREVLRNLGLWPQPFKYTCCGCGIRLEHLEWDDWYEHAYCPKCLPPANKQIAQAEAELELD